MKRKPLLRFVLPLFWSGVGTALLVVLLLILNVVNDFLESEVLGDILYFCWANVPLLLAISLLTGYAELMYKYRRTIAIIAPFLGSLAGVLILRFVFGLVGIANLYLGIQSLDAVVGLVLNNMFLFFVVFLLIGYLKYIFNLMKGFLLR
ncbi:hypothetical protein KY318_03350 [Candidatus Woesearchaeota archaeon]|nr:hypothetical protein [Candidatus Woesearchaeota archaeon]